MWQTVISFIVQNLLKCGGVWMVTHGLATSDQWTSFGGMVASLIGFVWHWHETHAAAVASGKVPAPSAPNTAVAAKVALLLLIPALFLSGCQSTPQQAVYRTAGATVVTVDAAMSEWGAYVQTWHPPVAQEQAVKAAYAKYQAAMAAVCDAGAIYAGSGQTNAPAMAGALQTAIANANSEISDLETLIASFGVQLH